MDSVNDLWLYTATYVGYVYWE